MRFQKLIIKSTRKRKEIKKCYKKVVWEISQTTFLCLNTILRTHDNIIQNWLMACCRNCRRFWMQHLKSWILYAPVSSPCYPTPFKRRLHLWLVWLRDWFSESSDDRAGGNSADFRFAEQLVHLAATQIITCAFNLSSEAYQQSYFGNS